MLLRQEGVPHSGQIHYEFEKTNNNKGALRVEAGTCQALFSWQSPGYVQATSPFPSLAPGFSLCSPACRASLKVVLSRSLLLLSMGLSGLLPNPGALQLPSAHLLAGLCAFCFHLPAQGSLPFWYHGSTTSFSCSPLSFLQLMLL